MDPRRVAALVATALLVAACTPAAPAKKPLLANLPKWGTFATDRFPGVGVCERCHTAGDVLDKQMRDASGADVSPITDANSSMMALSSRDPYYLAALARELEHTPADKQAEATELCVRCHAPVGNADLKVDGKALTLDSLERGSGDAEGLAREGVGCMGCHAAVPDDLGSEANLVGKQPLALDRVAYGALPKPADEAMQAMIKTRAISSPHVTQSELCASCHTVIVPSSVQGGGEIVEQATYLEWRSGSKLSTCQDCHMRLLGKKTPFSTRPPNSPARDGYRRHTIRGGSAYLLKQLSAHGDWVAAGATPDQLAASAADTAEFLKTAAQLQVDAAPGGVAVTVVNLTGHKLPTGYPSRRMWLHVVAKDANGNVVLESGASKNGAILGAGGKRLDVAGVVIPHTATIGKPDDVCIFEAAPVNAQGKRTHLLLGTAKIAKDNRILPLGYAPHGKDKSRTAPVGTDGDDGFVPGKDTIAVKLPSAAVSVDVELLYQAIPTETLESYNPRDSSEASRFLAITDAPPEPQVMATASWKR